MGRWEAFKPLKSAGKDDFYPKSFQSGPKIILGSHLRMTGVSIAIGYIPKTLMVLILDVGKRNLFTIHNSDQFT